MYDCVLGGVIRVEEIQSHTGHWCWATMLLLHLACTEHSMLRTQQDTSA